MELGVVVDEDFSLFACAIEAVAGGGVKLADIVFALVETFVLHVERALYELLDVKSGNGNREQSYRGEH